MLPVSPAKAFKTGRFVNKITLMVGVARDEFNGGLYTSLVAHTTAEYRAMVQRQFGDRASMVMALYPVARFPDSSPFIAHRTVMADAFSVCPALVADQQLARHLSVYAFENDNATTPLASPASGVVQLEFTERMPLHEEALAFISPANDCTLSG